MPPIFAAVKIFFQSRVLAHAADFLGLRRPSLHVHGNEAAGIFREIFGGVVALADGGNLELKLDQLRIEQAEQYVVGSLAVDRGEFEVLRCEGPAGCRPWRPARPFCCIRRRRASHRPWSVFRDHRGWAPAFASGRHLSPRRWRAPDSFGVRRCRSAS